jgi:hypothetical protein
LAWILLLIQVSPGIAGFNDQRCLSSIAYFAHDYDFMMPAVINRQIISVIVFAIGVSIGVLYSPEIITFSKRMVDVNLDKQQQENKSSPLNSKKSRKKRYA